MAGRAHGDGLPGPRLRPQPVDQGGRADRRGLPLPQAASASRRRWLPPSRCSRRCRSRRPTGWRGATRTSCPAASSSASCSPWRWPPTPTCWCWTSRPPASTRRSRRRCSTWSSSCATQFDTSILFVSHNLGIVARVCERVGVLYAGRLIEQGPAQRAVPEPAAPLHAGAAALHAAAGDAQGRRPARLDRGIAAAARRRDRRLRVRRPLPDRARPLPQPSRRRSSRWTSRHGARCFYHEEVPGIPPQAPGIEQVPAGGRRAGDRCSRSSSLVKAYGSGANAGAGRRRRRRRRSAAARCSGWWASPGSGKTSLAKCIVGLIDPTEGTHRVRAHGRHEGPVARPRGAAQAADGVPEPRQRAQPQPHGAARSCAARCSCWPVSGARGSRMRSWRR